MRLGKLFWKLLLGNLLLVTVILVACVWLIASGSNQFLEEQLTEHLHIQAATLKQALGDRLDETNAAELQVMCRSISQSLPEPLRITLILPNGKVIADSDADPAQLDSHAGRPEVVEALAKGAGDSVRFSDSVLRNMKYVALRVGPRDHPIGVVRISMSLKTISDYTIASQRMMGTIVLGGLGAAILLAMGLAALSSVPILRITRVARSLSAGDLTARVRVRGSDEWAILGRSLNQMRDNLAAQLETIDRQRRTLAALLAQLHEGVVVVGPNARVVLANPAAIRLLGISGKPAERKESLEGLAIEQIVAHQELQGLLVPHGRSQTVEADHIQPGNGQAIDELRIQVDGPSGSISVLARASEIVLPGMDGMGTTEGKSASPKGSAPQTGRLLVLTDVTELSRMIQVKADFAANASHELRTPLSAIRAAVETLLQLKPGEDPDSQRYLLGVIDRHSGRLQDMVADLMDLARIESSPRQFKAEPINTRELLADLRAKHEERIQEKRLNWEFEIPSQMAEIIASPHLLRLVLDNLLDNAIKFTDPGGTIRTVVQPMADSESGRGQVSISVSDTGCGIPEAEQSRVFERFYQVERARSGSIRGTGLGLSIVRHAVGAMHGEVSLTSKVGSGTTVTFRFPVTTLERAA